MVMILQIIRKQLMGKWAGVLFHWNETWCCIISRAAEEVFVNDVDDSSPGTEWERVARLCDFNPKSSKQAKDVSRMRSVLISLKQAPLVRWRESTTYTTNAISNFTQRSCVCSNWINYV